MPTKLRNPLVGPNKPDWNIYDVKDNPEYWLAESYATEFCDIAGIACIYHSRDNTIKADPLYGETPTIGYLAGKSTKIIFEVGDISTLYGMFGMVATDAIVAHIPQATWYRDVSKTEVPKPGDVVMIPFYQQNYDGIMSGRSFEITHAAFDQALFQLKSLVHVLYMIPYRFSEESQSARDVSSDLSMDMPGISAYGDNTWIDENAYTSPDVDSSIYGN